MNGTKIDTIKALYTYTIAAVVVIGGGSALVFLTLESNVSVVVAGFIGSALTFLFGTETATRTARQQQSASSAATIAATPGATTNGHAEGQ